MMTDQEILNRIDAEIARVNGMDWHKETKATLTARAAYMNGLRFTRALIEKRTEEVAF
jgi:hypothetical protein